MSVVRPPLARRRARRAASAVAPLPTTAAPPTRPPAVEFEHVCLAFDDHVVLNNLSFSIPAGAMRILLGASGSGKTLILKMILGLMRPDSGIVRVNGYRVDVMNEAELLEIRADIGMVFQENALFDSLTVQENVGYRLFEATDMPEEDVCARVDEVLGFVGLAEHVARMPAELSGGQRRRVAIARAMASRPSLLLFDDPTTGLDPIIATSVIDQIVKLRDLEQVTSLIVTHQIRDAFYIAEHKAVRRGEQVAILDADDAGDSRATFMVLLDGSIHFEGSGAALLASQDAYLKKFLFMTLPPW
jgi:phospholipid/cholesterol/gamma-HCH transport system ATP-binding protein